MKQKLNRTIQKIALILVCITTLNFIAPTQVSNASLGGVLFNPMKSVVLTIADIVMQFIQMGFTGEFRGTVRSGVLDGNYSKTNIWTGDDDKIDYPDIVISPEAIFSNQIEILNIDFINPINKKDYKVSGKTTTKALSNLRSVIASWYVAIRNLALVAMLSILVYVGIKIIISSAASDKAKYKQMLVDWIVGMCLLFMLHYIMAFTIFLTEKITDMISSSAEEVQLYYPTALDATDDAKNEDMKENREKAFTFNDNCDTYAKKYKKKDKLESLPNLTAYARFYAQMGGKHNKAILTGATYLIIYIVLIIFTVKFAFTYLKRVVMMAFLTIIAPFVAMTYPLDKMNDGKAQAFNMWLKEYLFNALIQPFHLVLYTVLIGTSVELARTNLIYALAALWFLDQAEELLKKMFGFDKAATPPGIGGAFAAGAGSQLAKRAIDRFTGGKANAKNGNGENGKSETSTIRKRNNYDFGEMNGNSFPESDGDSSSNSSEENDNNPTSQQKPEKDNVSNEQQKTENDNTLSLQQAEDGSIALGADGVSEDDSGDYGMPKGLEQAENGDLALGIGGEEQTPKENKRPKGTARKMAKLAGKKMLNSAGRTIRNPKTWKKLAKKATKAATTMAGAGIGFVAGAAKNGVSGALTGAVAGGAMGNKLGGAAFDKVTSSAMNVAGKFDDFRVEAEQGWDKAQENKKNREQQQQTKEFMRNTDNQKFFENKTGKSGKDLKETMEQAAYYNQYEEFEDNDAKLRAVELEKYYMEEKGYSQKDARTLVQAGASMANRKTEGDLNKKETYINEINNRGGKHYSEADKISMAKELEKSAKYLKGMTNKPGT